MQRLHFDQGDLRFDLPAFVDGPRDHAGVGPALSFEALGAFLEPFGYTASIEDDIFRKTKPPILPRLSEVVSQNVDD